ncbi:unnamed protein product, partial [marine sediment metagenome]
MTYRYVTGIFKSDSLMTIGLDFHLKNINYGGKKISLQIWDFAGESRFRFLLPGYIIGASGGIFMYDITRYSSFKNLDQWLNVISQGLKDDYNIIPILMVGGKADLSPKRTVNKEEAIEMAKSRDFIGYTECSSKSGEM